MTYRVEYLPQVYKTLEKMDKFTKRILVEWIEKNLVGCENPRIHGKPLSANKENQWRYCVGVYRIIAKIEDERLLILEINTGHRREIPNKKTLKAFKEVERIKTGKTNAKRYSSVDELKKDLKLK